MNSLLDKFILFEKKEELFDLSIGEVLIWDYIRLDIYTVIKKEKSNIKYTKKTLKQKPLKTIIGVLMQLWFVLFHLQLFSIKTKKEILVLGHPRRQKLGKYYEDIYTDAIVKRLSEKHTVVSLELPLALTHLKPISVKEVKYLDLLELGQTFSPYFYTFRISKEEKKRIRNIEKKIINEFDFNIDLYTLIKKSIVKYKYSYKNIQKIIDSISPRLVITVDGYNFTKKIFTEIANKKNIPTIELQHGTTGDEHIVYNFPLNTSLVSFSKFFFSWGEYWHLYTQFPSATQIYNLGFPYMNSQQKKVNILTQKETNILVSSQWTIGFELMDYINTFAENMRGFNFIVKLHPLEFDSLDSYKELALYPNISFVTNEMNIYDLFSICKTQIGVYSTTLVEGLAFNLRTLIVPLNGYNIYLGMIKKGYMFIINKPNDLNNFLEVKMEFDNIDKVWAPDALNNMILLIESLIKNHSIYQSINE